MQTKTNNREERVERLEEALLKIIERETGEAASPASVDGVARVAFALIELWKNS